MHLTHTGTKQVTVGGDKGYDTADFVAECRNLKVTPHVAQNLERPGGSAIDARTTHHAGYAISQRKRKRVEECFGWLKTIALLRKVRHRGIFKVGWVFTFACAAYNLCACATWPSPFKRYSRGRSLSGRAWNWTPGLPKRRKSDIQHHQRTNHGKENTLRTHFSAAC